MIKQQEIKVLCFFLSRKKAFFSEENKQKTFTFCAGTEVSF
jgi:hypothetical protein